MNQLELMIELNYDIADPGADFVFNIHAAQTPCQSLSQESLRLNQPIASRLDVDPVSGNRVLRLHARPGPLQLHYAVTIGLRHHVGQPDLIGEVPVHQLPLSAMGFIYPSRYCQSDRLMTFARQEFGEMPPGYRRVQAVCDWVHAHVTFASNSSDGHTSALDTLVDRRGVCRDFAHLMIALCRALNIPARFATGTDFGADLALGPPDFHAYVEVFLDDRWYIFDPSGTGVPMGFVRLGTGRDAADVAFATIFGSIQAKAPIVLTHAVVDASRHFEMPVRCPERALSTDTANDLALTSA